MFPKPERKKDRELLNSYHTKRCVVCSRQGCDPCHIISKGAHGPDEPFNLAPMCRICHSAQHKLGIKTFADRNLRFKNFLLANGWYFDEVIQKWRHEKIKNPGF